MAHSFLYIGLAWHFHYTYLTSMNRFITHSATCKSALTLGGYLNGESPKLNNSSAFYTKEKVYFMWYILNVYYFMKDQWLQLINKTAWCNQNILMFLIKNLLPVDILPSTQLQQKMCCPEDFDECQMPSRNLLLK